MIFSNNKKQLKKELEIIKRKYNNLKEIINFKDELINTLLNNETNIIQKSEYKNIEVSPINTSNK